jgi:beta-1,4-N-acetylglucosaminyltransferase
MIFLTVGTQLPFDRLIKTVDDAFDKGLIDEEIFAQIGESSYKPSNFEHVKSLKKSEFDYWVRKASSIISHAGIGTIATALETNKPLLVMPRLKQYGEVVNNHQVAIAKRFERLGHILVAYEVKEMLGKIEQLRTFLPRKRQAQSETVAERIAQFLGEWSAINE